VLRLAEADGPEPLPGQPLVDLVQVVVDQLLLGVGDLALVRLARVLKGRVIEGSPREPPPADALVLRRTGRAAVSSSAIELCVASLSKASASMTMRRGSMSSGRYRSMTATRSAASSMVSASSVSASISTGTSPSSGCSCTTMRASASSCMMSWPLRSLNRTVF